eukprot:snap_masked-scaffold_22-processed-gene-0.28-mRNA-1 protein AED:1.00 eAED:1.00 QI:0/-1/0/0/-1/1/1/0/87
MAQLNQIKWHKPIKSNTSLVSFNFPDFTGGMQSRTFQFHSFEFFELKRLREFRPIYPEKHIFPFCGISFLCLLNGLEFSRYAQFVYS